jgi:hypothetical protein
LRARKNRIKKLKKEDGLWEEEEEKMRDMAVQYFKNMYTRDPNMNPNEVISLVEPAVSHEMNDALCKDFSEDEIADPLFQIGP